MEKAPKPRWNRMFLPFSGLLFCLFMAFVLSFHVFSSVSIAHERTAVSFPYVSNHLREITHLPIFLYFITSQKRFNSYQNDVIALISNHIININTNFASRKKTTTYLPTTENALHNSDEEYLLTNNDRIFF